MTIRTVTFTKILTFPLVPNVPLAQFEKLDFSQKRAVYCALVQKVLHDELALTFDRLVKPFEQEMLAAVIANQGEDLREHYRPLLCQGLEMIRESALRRATNHGDDVPEALLETLRLLEHACTSYTDEGWDDLCRDGARYLYGKLGFGAADLTEWLEAAALCVLQEG